MQDLMQQAVDSHQFFTKKIFKFDRLSFEIYEEDSQ